jgi:hypothetical protein
VNKGSAVSAHAPKGLESSTLGQPAWQTPLVDEIGEPDSPIDAMDMRNGKEAQP